MPIPQILKKGIKIVMASRMGAIRCWMSSDSNTDCSFCYWCGVVIPYEHIRVCQPHHLGVRSLHNNACTCDTKIAQSSCATCPISSGNVMISFGYWEKCLLSPIFRGARAKGKQSLPCTSLMCCFLCRSQFGFQIFIGTAFSLHIIESVYAIWLGLTRQVKPMDIACEKLHSLHWFVCRMFV